MARKILVVDYEKDILDLGFEVSIAMTGKDALQMIGGSRVDLVLLDWNLRVRAVFRREPDAGLRRRIPSTPGSTMRSFW